MSFDSPSHVVVGAGFPVLEAPNGAVAAFGVMAVKIVEVGRSEIIRDNCSYSTRSSSIDMPLTLSRVGRVEYWCSRVANSSVALNDD